MPWIERALFDALAEIPASIPSATGIQTRILCHEGTKPIPGEQSRNGDKKDIVNLHLSS